MQYLFKILGKKKGLRQTGSKRWAVAAEVAFATALLLIGVVALVVLIVIQARLSTPEALYFSPFVFVVSLVVTLAFLTIAVLRMLTVLWRVGASAERRGAIVSRARDVELLNQFTSETPLLPTIPQEGNVALRRGERLRFRLHSHGPTRWSLLTVGAASAISAMVATSLIVLVVDSTMKGRTDWVGVVLATALTLATVWLFGQFFKLLLMQTTVGPTELEISNLPLIAGQTYTAFLSQPARLRLRLLELTLECEEHATFRQGTDIRTESQTVYSQLLFRKRGVEVEENQMFQTAAEFTLPLQAMHSFRSQNNRIQWQIRLMATVTGWPAIERRFPLVVIPPLVARASP
jgi:hypothetical protein